ncbi:hypothetical protein DNTS_004513 [Danionella cerebrum]|uniref:AGC-kinase C-terminal domain-containing protein n=1 Tax=Danionella cerebrum TaxID=2873325 RepID=A0A553QL84_9TELE|nr:hypothetical protein DNTS_004513 [Danionella translucida]
MSGMLNINYLLLETITNCNRRSSRDTCNFDREFTKMAVELTPTDKLFIMNLDQEEFQGFSYTNPEYEAPTQGEPVALQLRNIAGLDFMHSHVSKQPGKSSNENDFEIR